MDKSITLCVIDELFLEVRNSFSKNEKITDSVLILLQGIFDKVFKNAIDLIESNSVNLIKVKNNSLQIYSSIFQIQNKNGGSYVIFLNVNYCQCKFYQQKVLYSKSYSTCKHFLAASLAFIWKKFREFEVDFETYKNIIKNICVINQQNPNDAVL